MAININQHVEDYICKANKKMAELSLEATRALEKTGCKCDVQEYVDAILDINSSLYLLDKGHTDIEETYGYRNHLLASITSETENTVASVIDHYTIKYDMNESGSLVYPLYSLYTTSNVCCGENGTGGTGVTPNLLQVTQVGNFTDLPITHAPAVNNNQSATLGQVIQLIQDLGAVTDETDPVFQASPASTITSQMISNWITAYSWGNHALAGYLTSFDETDPVFQASPAATITNQLINSWNIAYDKHPTQLSVTGNETKTITLTLNDGSTLTAQFNDNEGDVPEPDENDFLTSASFNTGTGVLNMVVSNQPNVTVNLDGRYLTSFTEVDPTVPAHVKAITQSNINNWNSAYSWGDHALAGYLTSAQNDFLNNASFNIGTGVLTLSVSNQYNVTVDLDGRYLTSSDIQGFATEQYVNDAISSIAVPSAGIGLSIDLNGDIQLGDGEHVFYSEGAGNFGTSFNDANFDNYSDAYHGFYNGNMEFGVDMFRDDHINSLYYEATKGIFVRNDHISYGSFASIQQFTGNNNGGYSNIGGSIHEGTGETVATVAANRQFDDFNGSTQSYLETTADRVAGALTIMVDRLNGNDLVPYGAMGISFTANTGKGQFVADEPQNSRIVVFDTINNRGLVYENDYEPNFLPRSLVTKQYVDDVVAGIDETDPVFLASPAGGIESSDISNWNTAYSKHPVSMVVTGTSNKTITLTLNDSTTIQASFTDMVGDVGAGDGNDYLTSASFNTTTGLLTMVVANQDNVTVNLDGRYLIEETDPTVGTHIKAITATQISEWDSAYSWGDHSLAGYLTSETDPVFLASPAFNISSTDISNWNTAHSWGNHALAGYITGINNITEIPNRSYNDLQDLPALNFDNYQHWNLRTNGLQRRQIGSQDILDIVQGDNISVTYSAGGVVTINAVLPEEPVEKHIALIGNGIDQEFDIAHNLDADGVIVAVYRVSTGAQVDVAVQELNRNNVRISMNITPSQDEFKVVIV